MPWYMAYPPVLLYINHPMTHSTVDGNIYSIDEVIPGRGEKETKSRDIFRLTHHAGWVLVDMVFVFMNILLSPIIQATWVLLGDLIIWFLFNTVLSKLIRAREQRLGMQLYE